MIGLILKKDDLPSGVVETFGDARWKGREWFKIKGSFDQIFADNWAKYKGVYRYVAPADPVIEITDVEFSGAGFDEIQADGRVDLITDTNVTIDFKVPLPDNTKLTIPVRNKDSNQLKTVKAKVLNGAVQKVLKFPSSGFWVINSEEVNKVGRKGIDFKLDEVVILVQDN